MNDEKSFTKRFSGFLAHPFKTDGDVWNWILFTVFVVTVAVLWTRILNAITDEVA